MGDLNVRTHNLSRPKEPRKRKDLQFALHALALNLRCTLSVQQACCTKCDPLRDSARYAKWAGGSRSQTHRRAAMCGFTQDDGYVRGVVADAQALLRILP